jgi:hypothetical protein
MMYVQLEQAEDDAGEYYRVNTAFPVRQDNYPEKHGFKKLWDGSEPTSAVPGEQPAFASQPDNLSGQAAPNARGSREFNIRQPAEKYNTDSGDTPMQTSLTKSLGNKRILFFKSNIAAYTTRLGVFVPAHTDKRTNRSEAKHDSLTADMFSVPIPPTPKRDIPVEAMKKPEDFTPDMFTGKTKADIHHLDLPWEPASMQQRNGRGLRQGNTNKGVRIHNYLAKGSFDGCRSGS